MSRPENEAELMKMTLGEFKNEAEKESVDAIMVRRKESGELFIYAHGEAALQFEAFYQAMQATAAIAEALAGERVKA